MNNKDKFIDRTILKLNRKYGKDELVACLNKQIKDKDFEIGQLKSEIDHLKHNLKNQEYKNEISKLVNIELSKDKMYILQNKKVKSQAKEIEKLNKEKERLIIKISTND